MTSVIKNVIQYFSFYATTKSIFLFGILILCPVLPVWIVLEGFTRDILHIFRNLEAALILLPHGLNLGFRDQRHLSAREEALDAASGVY